MRKIIGYLVPENAPTNSNWYMFGEEIVNILTKQVRELANERNVKVPKSIGYQGSYGKYFFITYNSNKLRDLIVEVGTELNLKRTNWINHYGYDDEVKF